MDETEVIAWAMSIVATIAIVVIAFNVVTIRRILGGRQKRSDATDGPSTRP